jgi:hypothetical protein
MCGFLLGLLLGARPAHGAIAHMSQEKVCQMANQIVVGTVTNRSSAWWSGGMMLTTSTLAVERVIRGTPSASVQVKTLGGQIGSMVQHVGEEPAMKVGCL